MTWGLTFYVLAVISALCGFASGSAVGKALFFVFTALSVIALIADAPRPRNRS